MCDNKESKVFEYPYFSQTVDIYNYLQEEWNEFNIYFSQYLNKPSVCLETKQRKYEFHIAENSMQDNEVWLYKGYEDLPHKTSGGGYGQKLNNDLLEQVKEFLEDNGVKKPQKILTIFDFLEE